MPNLTPFLQKHFPFIFKPDVRKGSPLFERIKSLRPVSSAERYLTPSLGLAYYLEANVSVFADIALTLKQEVFRRGMVWKPRFAVKCQDCGCEYTEERQQCDCGSLNLRTPDRTQIQKFRSADGKSFLESANLNRQSLESVGEETQRHAIVGDRIYLLCIKNYLQSPDGEILASFPVEFVPLDPREIEPIEQDNGIPGGKYWLCLEHRDEVQEKPGICKCGKKLYEALYQTTGLGQKKQYYIENEIYFTAVYYPRKGYPPILKMLYDAYAYHYMELRTYNYHKKGRPPGFLAFPTNNLQSLNAQWEAMLTKAQEDPDNVQALGFDPGGGKGTAAFIKLMNDPGPEMLEVKKDLRERLGSMFGVSLIFQGDTSSSGGLNNEGLQITVTNRATEFLQKPWNGREQNNYRDGILYWVVSQFGITDFVLQLLPSEEQDEMAEKQRFALDADNAKKMLDMGYDVKFENGKFTFSGQAQKPQPPGFGGVPGLPPSPMPAPAPAQQPEARVSGAPQDMHKYDDSQPRADNGEWTDTGAGGGGGGEKDKPQSTKPGPEKPKNEMKPEKEPDQSKAAHETTRAEFYKIPEKEKLNEVFNNEEIVNDILREPDEYQRNGKLLEALENPNYVKDTIYWREELNEQPEDFRSKDPPKEGLEWEQTEGLLTFGTFHDAEEYGNLGIKQAPDKYVAYTGTKIKLHGQEADTGADEYLIENPKKIAEFSHNSLKGKHKAKVKRALEEGKQVSDKVLADYPDLREKFRKSEHKCNCGGVKKNDDVDEFDELNRDELVKAYSDNVIRAIKQGALYYYYDGVTEKDIAAIHGIIKQAFIDKRLSLREMVAKITEQTAVDAAHAEVIARTETSAVANSAKSLGWKKMEQERGEQFLYKWSVAHDHRTSDICLDIEQRVGEGVPLDELKQIIKEVSQSYIPDWNGWEQLVAHPNERSTPVRRVL